MVMPEYLPTKVLSFVLVEIQCKCSPFFHCYTFPSLLSNLRSFYNSYIEIFPLVRNNNQSNNYTITFYFKKLLSSFLHSLILISNQHSSQSCKSINLQREQLKETNHTYEFSDLNFNGETTFTRAWAKQCLLIITNAIIKCTALFYGRREYNLIQENPVIDSRTIVCHRYRSSLFLTSHTRNHLQR